MNWTGGSLSRSRRQNATLSDVQRKHFAKVRGSLQGQRPDTASFDFSIFQQTNRSTEPSSSIRSAPIPMPENRRTQSTLEEYGKLRPVVKQLESPRPRQDTNNQSLQISYNQASARPCQNPKRNLERFPPPRSNPVLITSSHTDDRLPPSIGIKNSAASDDLEVKRRDLLKSKDWAGLKKMQPIAITFEDAEDRDLIGKRRRVNRKCNQISQHRETVISMHEKLDFLQKNRNMFSSPDYISIRVRPSISGHGQQNFDNTLRERESGTETSDEMLFKDEDLRKPGAIVKRTDPIFRTTGSDEILFTLEQGNSTCLKPVKCKIGCSSHIENSNLQIVSPRAAEEDTLRKSRSKSVQTISSGSKSDYSSMDNYSSEGTTEKPVCHTLGGVYNHPESTLQKNLQSSPIATPCITQTTNQTILKSRRLSIQPLSSDLFRTSSASPQSNVGRDASAQRRRPNLKDKDTNSLDVYREGQAHRQENQVLESLFARRTKEETANLISSTAEEELFPEQISDRYSQIPDLSDAEKSKIRDLNLSEKDQQMEASNCHSSHNILNSNLTSIIASPDKILVPISTTTNNHENNLESSSNTQPLIPNPATKPLNSSPPDPTITTPHAKISTAAEDERVWRTFVFGSSQPSDIDLFPASSPSPSSPFHTSSILEPRPSSCKTQQSICAEAPLSSLDRGEEAEEERRREDETQESMVGHAKESRERSSSPGNESNFANSALSITAQVASSEDELARVTPRPPAVIFKRPMRYMGEVRAPVRMIGGTSGKKRGKGQGRERETLEEEEMLEEIEDD